VSLGAPAPPDVVEGPAVRADHVLELLGRDRWREALVEARALVEGEPDEPRFQATLGEALFRAGRLAEIDPLLGPLAAL
jgi:Flp pilus assembly protein TadD